MSAPGSVPKKRGRPRKHPRVERKVIHVVAGVKKRTKTATLSQTVAQTDSSQHGTQTEEKPKPGTGFYLGTQLSRWQQLMKQEDVDTDEDLAKLLLDSWYDKEVYDFFRQIVKAVLVLCIKVVHP